MTGRGEVWIIEGVATEGIHSLIGGREVEADCIVVPEFSVRNIRDEFTTLVNLLIDSSTSCKPSSREERRSSSGSSKCGCSFASEETFTAREADAAAVEHDIGDLELQEPVFFEEKKIKKFSKTYKKNHEVDKKG